MDEIKEKPRPSDVVIHVNKLPSEIVGRFLQNLSVGDRLKCERVSPRWKWALEKWGWTEQRKLDADIVFEGATEEEIDRFLKELDTGSCLLASLLNCIGPWLLQLDLESFGGENIVRFLPQILESLYSLKKLEKLDIGGLRLQDFIDHLPHTLRELETSGILSIETLQALSKRCPELEEVPFENLNSKDHLETEAVIELAENFLRQKKLDLRYFSLTTEKQGALASLGQLKALEQLDLWDCECLDGKSLGAIIQGCQQLRSLSFDAHNLTEGELFQLAKFQNLTVLEICDQNGAFTDADAILKEIARRGKMKKLIFVGYEFENASLTDASIVYLVDRCKALVSLSLDYCPRITERSLEAVIAEVQRRHGAAPWTLPIDNDDPEIFYFGSFETGIDEERAEHLIAGNQWMRFRYDPRQII